MIKPKIELRKVRHSKSLSEETPAYTADVYVDGKLFCQTTNHGQGGPDEQHPPKGVAYNDPKWNADLKALDAQIAETYAPHQYEAGGKTQELKYDLELVCHELLDEAAIVKDLTRSLARQILFQKPDVKGIYQVKKPADAAQAVKLMDAVKKKHGIGRTLNEMAFDEALAVYKAAA